MELFVQYLDDLEDLFYAFALKWERIKRITRFVLFIVASAAVQALGIYLALTAPPIATAQVALLLVGLLYYGAVGGPARKMSSV